MVFSYQSFSPALYQLVLIFVYYILIVHGPNISVHTSEPGPSQENVASTSRNNDETDCPDAFDAAENNAVRGFAGAFPRFWNRIHRIIALFNLKYESMHQTRIQIDPRLKAARLFEAGEGLYHGALRLEFRSSDLNAQRSSVFIQIPCLGLLYDEGTRLQLYNKEKYMYNRVLPAMYQIWPLEKLSPTCYVMAESGIMVVENLRESGFHSTERMLSEVSFCETVFISLAHFHALSKLYMDNEPGKVVSLAFFNMADRGTDIIQSLNFKAMLGKFRSRLIPSLSLHLQGLFEEMVSEARTILHIAHISNKDRLNVILHGSANRANVFFSTMANLPTSKFVSFQNSRLGSPVLDLVGYLISSVEFELFGRHQDALLNLYVHELNVVLMASGIYSSEQYSMVDLCADLKKYKLYFVYELAFKVPKHWTRYAPIHINEEDNHHHHNMGDGNNNEEDEYDRLLQNEAFILFFKNWMEVFSSW